jgi:hypothetical protein
MEYWNGGIMEDWEEKKNAHPVKYGRRAISTGEYLNIESL